jgi:hypothetical protein
MKAEIDFLRFQYLKRGRTKSTDDQVVSFLKHRKELTPELEPKVKLALACIPLDPLNPPTICMSLFFFAYLFEKFVLLLFGFFVEIFQLGYLTNLNLWLIVLTFVYVADFVSLFFYLISSVFCFVLNSRFVEASGKEGYRNDENI